ncbi:MAG: class II fumarate hydratase [Brachymonas sp.]|nr:class II fumarate hydratase [Brachymonas sp.]
MATRIEHDSLGSVEVPAERLWGAQTQRALHNFAISTERMPPEFVHALALVKRACAVANASFGKLDAAMAAAVQQAADEVLQGQHAAEFPLAVWQTGSGTQTNMNMNEVLARRASQLLGQGDGEKLRIHPNDHVNASQSSTDVIPTALHVAVVLGVRQRLLPALDALAQTLEQKSRDYAAIVKIGRTHLQDATPLTVGQEFSGWVAQLRQAAKGIEATLPGLHALAIGGTAVGTGLNAPPGFGAAVAAELKQRTGEPFVDAPNKFAALAAQDAVVQAHGSLRTLACALMKIANDVRWLASGPRAGLGELRLPANEPGSSIMPGKVNPTQSEALTMVAAQVLGNDVAVGVAGASGNFELNVFRPLVAHNVLQSIRLLADGMASFDAHCARGIEVDHARIDELMRRSLMLVTALAPVIGYEQAAKVALKAHAEGSSLREAALALGVVSAEDFDRLVDPAKMVGA